MWNSNSLVQDFLTCVAVSNTYDDNRYAGSDSLLLKTKKKRQKHFLVKIYRTTTTMTNIIFTAFFYFKITDIITQNLGMLENRPYNDFC